MPEETKETTPSRPSVPVPAEATEYRHWAPGLRECVSTLGSEHCTCGAYHLEWAPEAKRTESQLEADLRQAKQEVHRLETQKAEVQKKHVAGSPVAGAEHPETRTPQRH
jgi:type II secretory pathway component PulM